MFIENDHFLFFPAFLSAARVERNLRYWFTVIVPVLPLVLFPPSGVVGYLLGIDFLPVLEVLPPDAFLTVLPIRESTAAEPPDLLEALAPPTFSTESFLCKLAMAAFLADIFLPLTRA